MTTFKEFRKNKVKFFSWSGDFREFRQDTPSNLTEAINYDKSFHDDADVVPSGLSSDHESAMVDYTSTKSTDKNGNGSSHNVNSYLQNRSGDKSKKIIGNHTPDDVLRAVKKLSSVFTPENTNRKEIETYGAIPSRYANKLMSGDSKNFPGFTSTSSNIKTADAFTNIYGDPDNDHIIHYKIKPGAGLSMVRHSDYPEDEVLLHHGTKIEYLNSETVNRSDGKPLHIHHVIAHNEHHSLDSYGTYED